MAARAIFSYSMLAAAQRTGNLDHQQILSPNGRYRTETGKAQAIDMVTSRWFLVRNLKPSS
jgi:hypothetical protein